MATPASSHSRRPDGRNDAVLRPLSCELSGLHRADGSALWKSGSTHVLASVYGPIAPRIPSQENGQRALISVVIKSGAGGLLEREWEQWLTSLLEACVDTKSYARTVVQVVLQVIQDDGSVLAAALHAAVAALMDAGVAMTQLPVATTFLVVNEDDDKQQQSLLLDPTSKEELDGGGWMVMVTENESPDCILATHSTLGKKGGFSFSTILACAQAAAKATPAVVTFWRLAMEQKVTRESQTLWSSS